MTEREYVEAIKAAAERYKSAMIAVAWNWAEPNAEPCRRALRHWQSIRSELSYSTVIALCDAWLAQEATEAGEASA